MKLLFENWRKLISENQNNREFVFSKSEIRQLQKSIAKIVSAAKKVLGAEGPSPMLNTSSFCKDYYSPF